MNKRRWCRWREWGRWSGRGLRCARGSAALAGTARPCKSLLFPNKCTAQEESGVLIAVLLLHPQVPQLLPIREATTSPTTSPWPGSANVETCFSTPDLNRIHHLHLTEMRSNIFDLPFMYNPSFLFSFLAVYSNFLSYINGLCKAFYPSRVQVLNLCYEKDCETKISPICVNANATAVSFLLCLLCCFILSTIFLPQSRDTRKRKVSYLM